jgi:hypothetical protein
MTKIDKADLERVISRIKKFPKPTPRPLVQRAPISKHRLAAAKMLEATLAKAGLDVAKFDKLMAQDRREARAFLKKGLAKPSADARAAAKAAHRQRAEAYAKVGKLLTPDLLPKPQIITLPEPFSVSAPSAPVWKSTKIQPGGSYVKIDVDTNDNNNTDGIISFWYIWKNDSSSHLVMTALSNLIIEGTWYLEASPGYLWGLLGSDSAELSLSTNLATYRESGWGSGTDGTPYPTNGGSQLVFSREVGGDVNIGNYFAQGTFENLLLNVSQGPIYVPPGAVALFEVIFVVQSGFGSGGNIADIINIDLNSGGYGVYCPSLWLEIWFRYEFPFDQ